MDRADILQMMANTTFMTAQDAVDKGFADSISTGAEENSQVPQVVNAINTPIIGNNAISKIKTLMAKVRSAKPKNKVETPKNTESKPTSSLKDQKLAILFGRKDDDNAND